MPRITTLGTLNYTAQEGREYLNLVLGTNPGRLEATPGNLTPVLVKAVRELRALVAKKYVDDAVDGGTY